MRTVQSSDPVMMRSPSGVTTTERTEPSWPLRWATSAKVRASAALAERVRLGLHPYEALGLEVEKLAGDWDIVRILRKEYPLAADQQERVIDDPGVGLVVRHEGVLAVRL